MNALKCWCGILSVAWTVLDASGFALAPTGRLSAGAVPATRRVTRTESMSNACAEIRIQAAANEYEPFQVVFRAERAPVRGVTARVSDLVGVDNGFVISSSNVALFREYFLNVLQPSAGLAWVPTGEYPGPMLPFSDPYDPDRAPYGAPFDITRIGSAGKPWRKAETGFGFVFTDGAYTGRGDRRYVVQVTAAGNAGEGAAFRWSDSWQDGLDDAVRVRRWNAEGLPIPPFGEDRRTAPVALNDGVAVRFAYGLRAAAQHDFARGQTFHFNAYEAMNEVVWGELKVPADAPPGEYAGEFRGSAPGRGDFRIPIRLTVWPFALPAKKSVVTAYHGNLSPASFKDCPDAGWLYERLMHEHRIDSQRIEGGGVACDIEKDRFDWTAFDKAAAPRLDGSLYADGAPRTMFCFGLYGCGNPWGWEHFMKQDTNLVARVARRSAEHFREKGWFDRVYMYCHDEPCEWDFPNIIRDIRAFLEGDPGWRGKFMATSRPHMKHPLLPWVDIWCLIYNQPVDDETRRYLKEHGRKLWAYACCAPCQPTPTYFVDSLKGYEPRLIKWASWKMGAEGFLYWMMCYNRAHPNPWTTPMTEFHANGDGDFVFPGARNGRGLSDNATPLRPVMGPLVDFRIKQIREGLEDWEYLRMCENKRGREFVEAIVAEVFHRPPREGEYKTPEDLSAYWTQDDAAIYRAREKIARAIAGPDGGARGAEDKSRTGQRAGQPVD